MCDPLLCNLLIGCGVSTSRAPISHWAELVLSPELTHRRLLINLMFHGNNMFPLCLLSQVRVLFLLTEHTVTVEEQGQYPECVFWKFGDVCSPPPWGGLEVVCHICFQKCPSEMWHPSLVAPRRVILSAGEEFFSPTPSTVSWSLEGLLMFVCLRWGVGAVQQNVQDHPGTPELEATSAMCSLGSFPKSQSKIGDPKDIPRLRSCWSPAECLILC